MAIEKIKILVAVLDLSAKQHWAVWPILKANGLDWQCCLAGSSKTALRILFFSIAMGADYSSMAQTVISYQLISDDFNLSNEHIHNMFLCTHHFFNS